MTTNAVNNVDRSEWLLALPRLGKIPALNRAIAELDEKRLELTSSLVSSDRFTIQPPAEAKAKEGVQAANQKASDQ